MDSTRLCKCRQVLCVNSRDYIWPYILRAEDEKLHLLSWWYRDTKLRLVRTQVREECGDQWYEEWREGNGLAPPSRSLLLCQPPETTEDVDAGSIFSEAKAQRTEIDSRIKDASLRVSRNYRQTLVGVVGDSVIMFFIHGWVGWGLTALYCAVDEELHLSK